MIKWVVGGFASCDLLIMQTIKFCIDATYYVSTLALYLNIDMHKNNVRMSYFINGGSAMHPTKYGASSTKLHEVDYSVHQHFTAF